MDSIAADLEIHVAKGIDILRKDGVIVFPTDTLYGLGCDAFSRGAVARIIGIKGRPYDKGLPLLLASAEDAEGLALDFSPLAKKLAQAFWPGALTLVLRASRQVLPEVTGDRSTVALRVPDHPVPRALVRGVGRAIIGTSANLRGEMPSTTAREAESAVGGTVDYVLDGGPADNGAPSTVVDLSGECPVLLRQGVLSREALEGVCGSLLEL
jgi:L-threonylcarbamoyladenylate synthase